VPEIPKSYPKYALLGTLYEVRTKDAVSRRPFHLLFTIVD